MKQTEIIMGMPITVEVGDDPGPLIFTEVFDYFRAVDEKFSTYKSGSEISRINRHELTASQYSPQMREVFTLAEQTKKDTHGFFDITKPDGLLDPSGLVKGWAIQHAAEIMSERGFKNFYVEAGGDIQTSGKNSDGVNWKVGIRNPFKLDEIVKIIFLNNQGIATSGNYLRGAHIYNPHNVNEKISGVVSLSVIGPSVYDADRFATAAFAMGRAGINFIEKLSGLEAYMIDESGIGTETSGFAKYTNA